jgi:hypothetical protein
MWNRGKAYSTIAKYSIETLGCALLYVIGKQDYGHTIYQPQIRTYNNKAAIQELRELEAK